MRSGGRADAVLRYGSQNGSRRLEIRCSVLATAARNFRRRFTARRPWPLGLQRPGRGDEVGIELGRGLDCAGSNVGMAAHRPNYHYHSMAIGGHFLRQPAALRGRLARTGLTGRHRAADRVGRIHGLPWRVAAHREGVGRSRPRPPGWGKNRRLSGRCYHTHALSL